jgi:hypothetical protein
MMRRQKFLKKENAAVSWEFGELCVALDDTTGGACCDEITK